MKTEMKIRIVAHADGIAFGYWDADKGDEGEYIILEDMDEMAVAAEKLDCSPALVEALMLSMEGISHNIGSDLRDIWRRLDAIETQKKYL